MRRAAKVDATQTAIVEALRRAGIAVEIIGKPVDLLVCCRGETSLMEVKSPKDVHRSAGEGLTKDQVEFIGRWPGKIHIVRSAEEAFRALIPEAMT
jgi:predicted amino acid dehydrogenase